MRSALRRVCSAAIWRQTFASWSKVDMADVEVEVEEWEADEEGATESVDEEAAEDSIDGDLGGSEDVGDDVEGLRGVDGGA